MYKRLKEQVKCSNEKEFSQIPLRFVIKFNNKLIKCGVVFT